MIKESTFKNPNFSLDTLKGMQSVRATFTLPKQTIKLLTAVATQLGVKQKSIFDHLIENINIMDQIADAAKGYQPQKNQRKQKTFVLSRNCLSALESFSRQYQLPRDVLVEFSIQQLHPVIAQEKQRHENRKKLLREMEGFRNQGRRFMEKARLLAGEDGDTLQNLEKVFDQYDKGMDDLKTAIERGRSMEQFQWGESAPIHPGETG